MIVGMSIEHNHIVVKCNFFPYTIVSLCLELGLSVRPHPYEKHNTPWRGIAIVFGRLPVALTKVTLWCEHLGGVAPWVDVACELLLRVELLVLALCPPLGDQTGDDCQSASGNDDTTTSLVSWLL